MFCAVGHQRRKRRAQPGRAVLREERGPEGRDHRLVAPVRPLGQLPEARGGFEDFSDAFPRLLSGKTGELAERGFVGGLGEQVLAENAEGRA